MTDQRFAGGCPGLVANQKRDVTNATSVLSCLSECVPSAMRNESQSKVIEDNPIGNGLDAFCASFNSICEGAGISCCPDALDELDQEGVAPNTLLQHYSN